MNPSDKPFYLFADLAEKQRILKQKMRPVSLEEARKLAQWIKIEGTKKRKREEDHPHG